MSVVVEYHAHQPTPGHVRNKPAWVCSYVYLDGTACPDFVLGPAGCPINWSGSRAMTREAIEAHSGEETAKKIEAYRDANDFARPPDWWQAIDAALDICRGKS